MDDLDTRDLRETAENKERREHQENSEDVEMLAKMADQEILDQRDPVAYKDQQVQLERQVPLDKPDLMVHVDHLAFLV